MKKGAIWFIVLVLVFLGLQFLSVKLVFAHKLPEGVSYFFAKVYHLSAGEIKDQATSYPIYLTRFLDHQKSLAFYVKNNPDNSFGDDDLGEVAWQRSVKDAWLEHLAQNYKLSVADKEVEDYLKASNVIDQSQESFADFSEKTYGISLAKFKAIIVKPFLLEAKVYQYMLENFNDPEGMKKAQAAYAALEGGKDFMEVAKEFSFDLTYAESGLWLKESELIDFYEPIKGLEVGKYSQIVITPGAYVIWKLESIVDGENGEKVWQVKPILVQAKTLEEFFKQYIQIASVKKNY